MSDIDRLADIVIAIVKAATGPIASRVKALDARVSAFREGRDGVDGLNGKDGTHGRDGLPGVQGPKGADGTNGRDGQHGKDGMDGLGFDDMTVEHDGERGFTFKFVRAGQTKTFGSFTVPAMIYRGVFDGSKTYQKGDVVTWGGSGWHAEAETSAKPGEPSTASRAWKLMVKKGADGKGAK